jgi:protein TonB
VVAAAAAAHAAVLGLFLGASALSAWFFPARPAPVESVTFAVAEAPAPPPPAEPPPAPAAEPVREPLPVPKVVHRPPPVKRRPKRAPEPPPDPVEQPEPPKPELEPPRAVVGLDPESTIPGGSGPAFATGNTRMGETAGVAESPSAIAPLPAAAPAAPPSEKLIPPRRLGEVRPKFPDRYRELPLDTEVVILVRLHIDARGEVRSVDIVNPSRYDDFNRAAEMAARQERFVPARRGGVPTASTISIKYHFQLRD